MRAVAVQALNLGPAPGLITVADVMVTVDPTQCSFIAKAKVSIPLIPLQRTEKTGRHIRRCIAVAERIKRRCQALSAVAIMAVGAEVRKVGIRGKVTRPHKTVNAAIIWIYEFHVPVFMSVYTVADETGAIKVCTVVGMGITGWKFRCCRPSAPLGTAVTAGACSA